MASTAGTPATGTVTFYVNGSPVGTRALTDGAASLPFVFAAGEHAVTASYSGSAEVAAVASSAVAPVDVVVAAPSTEPPTAPTSPPANAAPPAGAHTDPGSPGTGDTMAHTGGEARTLVSLAAVLLAAGVLTLRLRRRTR